MFAIVIYLVLLMCTLNVLCVFIVEIMSVVVNVMLTLMSVISPHLALFNLSVRTVVKLYTFGGCLLWG